MFRGIRRSYADALWASMDVIGVDGSIEHKIATAVGIQFLVSVAQAIVPLVTSGEFRFALSGLLFVGAAVAFVNTIFVTRADIVEPITELEAASRDIASGTIDVDVPIADQPDEIGSLVDSFQAMQSHLHVVATQAEALSDQHFDAPAMKSEVPGRFGRLLNEMTENLQSYIEQIEADRDRFRLLAHLVSHDIPNVVNVIDGRIGLAREATDDPEVRTHLDVAADQTDQITDIATMVRNLTATESVEPLDLRAIVEDEVDRVRDAYESVDISLESPESPVLVVGNELLTSVFANLLTNAIEHCEEDPARVTVSIESSGSTASVVVADDGPGLGADTAEDLFADAEPHSGLGLVKTVTERFDGSIDVDSSDEGTTMTVHLPCLDDEG
ncbi:sensor histidine kinase [Halanaeroarchaeum sulfurireducens]|uniref:histidine kinase n=1 Tax=Halanaeroarchaeum sulfurireducens TaxID=1604004 RepID=A0A0F7PFA5_9EURY|nr:HAMP domain-containing sensor histidine kinase [Halanaeroarchaeum sulfurireducens]AKH98204.1 signal-transducing histidine kinase [Halanaeroarchaeum sulfurireducens]ALG82598.1 signal-transducing histidine kinase [Halanaeroarchaeum sulfurireducens]